ncbi:DNA replication protein DnaD [Paenibacillus macerans]|uniref:DNA replication protein DnaD n=1 Tax=Paenibacillus macerans TaxID=44252 RepID=UPI00203C1C8D|nr:DNA replication protein DnaD [Paenibacillus macerans]MCM3703822.1 DNA replication protein DnaD [Paenibacillus macerans]
MAEKRMISKVISISEKVNNLSDFDALLYTWMIPHTDDFGRLEGSPGTVRALVIPRRNNTDEDVRAALQSMAEAELILWYKVNNKLVIQIANFEDHQQGLHKRTRSKLPEPPGDSESYLHFPGISGNFPNFPSEGKGIEGNRTEEKGTEEEGKGTESAPASLDSIRNEILKLCNECNLQKISIIGIEEICSFIKVVEQPVIERAIKKAQDKHINYAINTLQGWVSEGKTTLSQVQPASTVGTYKGGRNQKPDIQIVQNTPNEPGVSDEEMAKLIEMAKEMEAKKKNGGDAA